MSGIYFNFKVGRAGTSQDNIRYITRETATKGDREAVFVQNYPDYVQGETYKEQRNELAEYGRQQEQDEMQKSRKGTGEARTHYRAIASFENKVETEKARDMAEEYLSKQFPNARAVAVVHQDTEHTHIHFHIQARNVEGKKLSFKGKEWKEIDREWNKIYSREFGKEKEAQHLSKKAETAKWKQSPIRIESKPARVDNKSVEIYRERDRKNAGVYELNKEGIGRDKRSVADENNRIAKAASNITKRQSGVDRGKRAANEFIDKSKRATQQFNRTESRARDLSGRIEGLRGEAKRVFKKQDRLIDR